MSSPKNAGSLTAGLLARKGLAQPAMRRQPVTGLTATPGPRAVSPLDDLGWNDMGDDGDQAPSPVALHIAAIQETLDRRKTDRPAAKATPLPQPVVTAAPVPAPVVEIPPVAETPAPSAPVDTTITAQARSKARSAFTLRIDADRHLRLRLLSAVTNRSAQQLLTGALDALIAQHPEIDALAANPKLRQASDGTDTE